MIISIIKYFLLIISTIGIWELMRQNTRIDKAFIPSATIAVQVLVLFFGGILNALYETSYIIFIGGIVCFVIYAFLNKGISFIKEYITISYLYIAICIILLTVWVNGKIFTSYDNFTHWAIVVKQMLITNRFPTFKDPLITFQHYPLGSSMYIYYISRIVNIESESLQMLSQDYMIVSLLAPIFIYCKRRKILSLIYMIVFTSFLFVYNISATSLLVDTLLPIAGACTILFVYKLTPDSLSDNYTLTFIISYVAWVSQIKNSGILFCLFATALLGAKILRKNKNWKNIFALICPYLPIYLWNKHCNYVFDLSEKSNHAMTYSNYKGVLAEKTPEIISQIGTKVLRFSVTYKDSILVSFGFLISGILIWLFVREVFDKFALLALFSALTYFIYQLGLFGMYVFSMRGVDATELSSVTRYEKTILIFLLYFLAVTHIKIIDIERIAFSMIITVFLCAEIFLFMTNVMYGQLLKNYTSQYDPSDRLWMQRIINKYSVPGEKSYCFLRKTSDANYFKWVARYELNSIDTEVRVIDSYENLEEISAEYIIIEDVDNIIVQQWIKQNYPEQMGNEVIKTNGVK